MASYGVVRRMDNGWVSTPNEGLLIDVTTGNEYHFYRPDYTGTGEPPKWNVEVHDIVKYTLVDGVPTDVTLYKKHREGFVPYGFPIAIINIRGGIRGQGSVQGTGILWSNYLVESTGTGTGVSTLALEVSSNITVTLNNNANFYTNPGGTEGEAKTWNVIAGAIRTIYLKCTAGTASMIVGNAKEITYLNWISGTNAASITLNLSDFSLITLYITGNSDLIGAMPSTLQFLHLESSLVNWIYEGALPTGLISLYIFSASTNISWTYTGALPEGLTYCLLESNGINWTYAGVPPANIESFLIQSNNVAWTYNGALPSTLKFLYLGGNNLNWTYNGALPAGLQQFRIDSSSVYYTYDGAMPDNMANLYINGVNVNWTGLDVGSAALMTYLYLYKFRQVEMTSSNMVTLLTQIKNDVGLMSDEIWINDYADDADPPSSVVDAIYALMVDKSIADVHLGSYNVSDIPSILSAYIDAEDSTKVIINTNTALNESYVPATTAFTIPSKTISLVSISGDDITLTVTVPFTFEDTPTVSYTKPSSNWIRSTNNGLLGTFVDRAVTNQLIPSYDNEGGKGNRSSLITVTNDMPAGSNINTKLIDGNNQTDGCSWTGNVTGKYIKFDFKAGASKLITEFKWFGYQNQYTPQGNFRFMGSNNDSDWDDLTGIISLYGDIGGAGHAYPFTNSTGYRYYRLFGTSGSGDGRYSYEIEFKIANT